MLQGNGTLSRVYLKVKNNRNRGNKESFKFTTMKSHILRFQNMWALKCQILDAGNQEDLNFVTLMILSC